jgi:branched-subunit amino acid aminotransferase/4-amino-4-deoxychorismate lyase
LVSGGRAVALDAHLARLEASLREVHGTGLPADLRARATDAAANAELGRLRVTVAPGEEAQVEVSGVDEADLFPAEATAIAPVVVPGGIGAHKWADRRLLERAEALAAPDRPLLVDGDGSLLEGARGNVFLVRDDALLTPPLDGRILPGITRAQAI